MVNISSDYRRPHGPVKRIEDPEECDRLLAITNRIAQDVNMVSPDLLANFRWAAVPIIDSITEDVERRTVSAIRKNGTEQLWIVCTNPPFYTEQSQPEDYIYKVDLTEYSHNDYLTTSTYEYVIFPSSIKKYPAPEDFILLYGAEGEHYIIAGPKPFVEVALGKSIEAGRAEFRDWIDQQGSAKLEAHLQAIADRCAPFNGD